MSRSRRAPYWTEGQESPGERKKRRRLANRRVRETDEIGSNPGAFKRMSNSYDIIDFKFEDKNNPKVRRK